MKMRNVYDNNNDDRQRRNLDQISSPKRSARLGGMQFYLKYQLLGFTNLLTV